MSLRLVSIKAKVHSLTGMVRFMEVSLRQTYLSGKGLLGFSVTKKRDYFVTSVDMRYLPSVVLIDNSKDVPLGFLCV